MKRLSPIHGSILFFFLAPGVVAGVVPMLISGWRFHAAFFGADVTRFLGAALVFAGLDALVDSFGRFAIQGLGTPAPVSPPRRLVVSGSFRHVRNPMYIAVIAVILGQALFFADVNLVLYAAVVGLAFHAFVTLYEEPVLARSFGAEYETYRANVRRWLPRWSPWGENEKP